MSDLTTGVDEARKPLPRERTWHVMQTLLGCGPGSDVNRRILYRGFDEIAVFNQRMAEWHPEDNAALHKLARRLNEIERERLEGLK